MLHRLALLIAVVIGGRSLDEISAFQEKRGTITGEVILDGAPPAPAPPAQVKAADATVCGQRIPDESMIVGLSGGVQNAIVYLDIASAAAGPKRAGAEAEKVRVTNHNCRFQPRVQTATVGSTLLIGNDDNILHNTHAYIDGATTLFNIGLPFQGLEVSRPLSRPGLITFKCDAGHTWMNAYLLVLSHEFHTVTSETGEFKIGRVPSGSYSLAVWHEKLGTQSTRVQVRPDEEARVRIHFKGSP